MAITVCTYDLSNGDRGEARCSLTAPNRHLPMPMCCYSFRLLILVSTNKLNTIVFLPNVYCVLPTLDRLFLLRTSSARATEKCYLNSTANKPLVILSPSLRVLNEHGHIHIHILFALLCCCLLLIYLSFLENCIRLAPTAAAYDELTMLAHITYTQ